ncbi:MAG: rhodanese-like domain-containing protein [bacterium]
MDNIKMFSVMILLLLAMTPAVSIAENKSVSSERWSATFDHLRDMQPCWAKQSVVDVAARQDRGERLLFVDVRTPREWQHGIVPGALTLNLNSLPREEGDTKLPGDKSTPIVVYCKAGHRATIAMTYLQYLGYQNAIVMSGGFSAWEKSGMPVAKH